MIQLHLKLRSSITLSSLTQGILPTQQQSCSLVSSVWPGCVYRTVCTRTGSPSSSSSSSLSLCSAHAHTVTPTHSYKHTCTESFSVFREQRRHFKSPCSFHWDPRSENKHTSRSVDESHLRDEGGKHGCNTPVQWNPLKRAVIFKLT